MPRSGGNAASCHPGLLHICTCSECTFRARARLLLLRLSRRCLALDLRTGAAGSSSGSLCTSQRDGDLKRRRGLVGEVTGEVSLWTRVPNMVIIRPALNTGVNDSNRDISLLRFDRHDRVVRRTRRGYELIPTRTLRFSCSFPPSAEQRRATLSRQVRAKSTGGSRDGNAVHTRERVDTASSVCRLENGSVEKHSEGDSLETETRGRYRDAR